MTRLVKNLPAMQETWVCSLDLKDPLEKGMATHSSILAWKSPWIEEPEGLQSMGLQRVRREYATNTKVIHSDGVKSSIYFGRVRLGGIIQHIIVYSFI